MVDGNRPDCGHMMRRVLLSLVVALAACATTPSSADPLEGADPQVLNACVAAAGASREGLQNCAGAVAGPCMQANGPSTMSDVLCWSAESDAWHEQITQATARLSARASDRDPARLEAANTAWAAWLDAECEYWAWEEGGGSGERVDRVRCAARLATARAIDLIVAADAP